MTFYTVRLNGKYQHATIRAFWHDDPLYAVRYPTRDAAVAVAQAFERKGHKDVVVQRHEVTQ